MTQLPKRGENRRYRLGFNVAMYNVYVENKFILEGIKYLSLKEGNTFFWEMLDRLNSVVPYFDCRYTRHNFEYYEQRYQGTGNMFKSESFILLQNNQPFFALIGSIIFGSNGKNQLCAYEVPSGLIEIPDASRTQTKSIIKYLRTIIDSSSTEFIVKEQLFGGKISSAANYLLLERNYYSDSQYSYYINLSSSEATLKSNIRKSYHSLINWGTREMKINLLSSNNITWQDFLSFRDLHIRESGKETRSLETWKKQYESVIHNEAFVVTAHISETLVSAALFWISKTHCYYAVSASRRDMFEKPLIHSVLWKAILYAKSIGILFFETGQCYPCNATKYIPSKKEKQIETLRSGFGGKTKISLILSSSK